MKAIISDIKPDEIELIKMFANTALLGLMNNRFPELVNDRLPNVMDVTTVTSELAFQFAGEMLIQYRKIMESKTIMGYYHQKK